MFAPHPPRFTIALGMAAIALGAALLVSPFHGNEVLFNLCLFGVEVAFPIYLLLRLGRRFSAFEVLAASMALAYLAWGAIRLFRPGHVDQWDNDELLLALCHAAVALLVPLLLLFCLTRARSAAQVSLLAGLAVAYLVVRLLYLSYPLASELSFSRPLALCRQLLRTLTELFHPGDPPRYLQGSPSIRRWNWGLLALLYAGFLASAVAARIGQARSENAARAALAFRRARLAVRLVDLQCAAAVGFVVGLLWTWCGWPVAGGVALALCAFATLGHGNARSASRPRPLARALAAYWAFAVSVQLFEPPSAPPVAAPVAAPLPVRIFLQFSQRYPGAPVKLDGWGRTPRTSIPEARVRIAPGPP